MYLGVVVPYMTAEPDRQSAISRETTRSNGALPFAGRFTVAGGTLNVD